MSVFSYFIHVGLRPSYLVCLLFSACLVLEPISFDLSPKSPTDNFVQSLGQEVICRSETNWDLGLGESTLIHLGRPYASFLRIH
jgi:hypothetical protein